MSEDNAYILGTDNQELYRLGLQHQVWASEAQKGWHLAQFNAGQTILDLGSGPGFCSKELAFIAGEKGKVIAVDRSAHYIKYLQELAKFHHLNIDAIEADFNEMTLAPNSIDRMYCRWALAWLPDTKPVLQKVLDALKPGGKMVIHEYYNWSTHQTEPSLPGLTKAIGAALKSFKDSDSEIDIGKELPGILTGLGMKIDNIRLMTKLGRPDNAVWQWPKSFYESYFPRLVDIGYLQPEEVTQALEDLKVIEQNPITTLSCPMMVEVIATK